MEVGARSRERDMYLVGGRRAVLVSILEDRLLDLKILYQPLYCIQCQHNFVRQDLLDENQAMPCSLPHSEI